MVVSKQQTSFVRFCVCWPGVASQYVVSDKLIRVGPYSCFRYARRTHSGTGLDHGSRNAHESTPALKLEGLHSMHACVQVGLTLWYHSTGRMVGWHTFKIRLFKLCWDRGVCLRVALRFHRVAFLTGDPRLLFYSLFIKTIARFKNTLCETLEPPPYPDRRDESGTEVFIGSWNKRQRRISRVCTH